MKKYYEPDRVAKEIPFEPIPQEVRAQYLRPGELLAIQEKFPVAFMPLGTLEWHGRHNPIGCDAIKAENVCIQAAQSVGGVVMPPLYFASDVSWNIGHGIGVGMNAHAGFQLPGSFYHFETHFFRQLLLNACSNYLARGFKLVIMVSGHNPQIQQNVMDDVCYTLSTADGKEPVCCIMECNLIAADHPLYAGDHAAGYETGMMMLMQGDRVNLAANDGQPNPDLGVAGAIPVAQSSYEDSKARFELQVAGLVRMAQEKLEKLKQQEGI